MLTGPLRCPARANIWLCKRLHLHASEKHVLLSLSIVFLIFFNELYNANKLGHLPLSPAKRGTGLLAVMHVSNQREL